MSTWAPSLVKAPLSFPSPSLRDSSDKVRGRSHEPGRGRAVDPYETAAPGVLRTGCSVRSGAGQGPYLQLRVLGRVRLLLGQQGAEDAEQETDRDRDDAGVLQRE